MTCCEHYYADRCGQCGWPTCVKCGAPAGLVDAAQLRACCNTRNTGPHVTTCQSIDAQQQRVQRVRAIFNEDTLPTIPIRTTTMLHPVDNQDPISWVRAGQLDASHIGMAIRFQQIDDGTEITRVVTAELRQVHHYGGETSIYYGVLGAMQTTLDPTAPVVLTPLPDYSDWLVFTGEDVPVED